MQNHRNIPAPMTPAWRDEAGRADVTASRLAAARVAARMQECWRNAALAGAALIADDMTASVGLTYHEGLAIIRLFGAYGAPYPVEHGWLETRAGRIIDPTLPLTMADDAELEAVCYITAFAWPADVPGRLVLRYGSLTLPFSGMGGVQLIPTMGGAAPERLRATWEHMWSVAEALQRNGAADDDEADEADDDGAASES